MSSTPPSILKRLLEGLASCPDPCFREKELRGQWPTDCDSLTRLGILKSTSAARWIEPEIGVRRMVVVIAGKPFSVDPEAPAREPVPVEKSDISRVRLNEREFAKWISATNNLTGKQEFLGALWSLGYAKIQNTHVQVYYVSPSSGEAALGPVLTAGESLHIGRSAVVLSANLDWVDALTLKALAARRVVIVELGGLIHEAIFDLKRIEMPPLENAALSGVEVLRHIDRRFDTLGQEYSSLKEENAFLKQKLAEQLIAIGKKVDPKFFHWIVTILGAGSTYAASKLLGVPKSTLAEGMKKFEQQGDLYAALVSMVHARQKSVGKKSIEGFNEEFLHHQGSVADLQSDTRLLYDVLEGLQEMNAGNWKSVQKELVNILLEVIPEK